MENEDIGFWLFMPSWNKDHLSDMPCNLNQIILGLYSSTELPCLPFLPKPLNFPPIIFCYWNWCLSVSLCHLLVWVRGSNSYWTMGRMCHWSWDSLSLTKFKQLSTLFFHGCWPFYIKIFHADWCRVNPK